MSSSDSKQPQETPTNEHCDSPLVTSGVYHLETAEHGTYALTNMYEMKQRGQLCDVILKVGLETFKVHRVVLASISPYFFTMFKGKPVIIIQSFTSKSSIYMFSVEIKDKMNKKVHAEIHDIDAATMELLLNYAYTGKITIRADNGQFLLSASSILQMEKVREGCCHFLTEQLHPMNCLGIRRLADTHSCKELSAKSHSFVLQNFQQVIDAEEFLLSSFKEVEELLSNNELNTSSEEDVFSAVLKWIKHDLINRRQYIGKLMVHVRLPLVSKEFLMARVDNEDLMREDLTCRELLLEAMRYHLAPGKLFASANPRTVERKSKALEPYLFVIGGRNSFTRYSECKVYNPRSDSWSTIAPMRWKRSGAGVTGLHRLLYAVGGYDGISYLTTAECYDPLVNTWTSITPMDTARGHLGICSFNGLIYVCGGYDGVSNWSSMEKFDPLTGVWYNCPPMSTIRGYCDTAVLENCIYAIGGSDSKNYSIEKFDPREGNWSLVTSTSSELYHRGVAALDGHLYCVGGYNGSSYESSGERFDIRKNTWEPISAMHNPRSLQGVVAIDDCIYAAGGYSHPSSLSSVEKYDPKTNQWFVVSSMEVSRHLVGAAVLDCIDIEQVLKRTGS